MKTSFLFSTAVLAAAVAAPVSATVSLNSPSLGAGGGEAANLPALVTPAPAAAVPEPGTWAMLIAGFGFVGYALRRRRTVAA